MDKIKDLLNEEKGKLITITARPGVGKSTFLKNILDLVEGKVLYFDLEDNCKNVCARLDKIGIKNMPIVYDKPNITINEIEETIRRLQTGENIKVVMIDYLQLINNVNNEDIPDILNKIANQLDITIIITSQLSNIAKDNNVTIPLVLEHLRNNNKSILKYSDIILLLTNEGNYEDNIINIKIQGIKNNVNPMFVEEVKLDKEKGLFYND